jgi:hypothetical protein
MNTRRFPRDRVPLAANMEPTVTTQRSWAAETMSPIPQKVPRV